MPSANERDPEEIKLGTAYMLAVSDMTEATRLMAHLGMDYAVWLLDKDNPSWIFSEQPDWDKRFQEKATEVRAATEKFNEAWKALTAYRFSRASVNNICPDCKTDGNVELRAGWWLCKRCNYSWLKG